LAYQYAAIYTQWGDTHEAAEWLETALRLRDSGLGDLKSDRCLIRFARSRVSKRSSGN
jgi:hypothetical protein